jgi:hypothetical protein
MGGGAEGNFMCFLDFFVRLLKHVRGRALIHLGAQRHGADDISGGERNNLVR